MTMEGYNSARQNPELLTVCSPDVPQTHVSISPPHLVLPDTSLQDEEVPETSLHLTMNVTSPLAKIRDPSPDMLSFTKLPDMPSPNATAPKASLSHMSGRDTGGYISLKDTSPLRLTIPDISPSQVTVPDIPHLHTALPDTSDVRLCETSHYVPQLRVPACFQPSWAWMWVWLSAMILSCAETKYVEGELKTAEKWAFLTRFCFLSEDGTFSFDIEYDMDFAMEKLLLYYDSPHQWPAVYKSDKTCEEREAVMKRENNQFINLTLMSMSSECEVFRLPKDKAYYHCKGKRSFRSVRERWWFIAVSNCNSSKGLHLKYRLTMTNGYEYWYKHFSADEFYILRTDLTALLMQLGILFLSLLASVELKNRKLFHTTYQLYMAAVVMQVLALIFLSLHYARYGYDGVGLDLSKLIGRVMCSLSTVLTVLMLLLMGKGFNITRGRLRQTSAVRLSTFMCLYVVTYASLFIYEQQIFDPGEVLYVYESPAGYGLLLLRCVAWLMFLYSCFFTIKHYPEKGSFYYPFFVFFTLWFLSGPVVIVISNHVIDKWVREKVVNAVELSITLLGHAFFLFLTRPSAANKNFPYHVKTTQITALEVSQTGIVGNNTLDAFSAHAYAPDIGGDQPKNFTTPDLFLVSGAVEMRPVQTPKSIVKEDNSFPHYTPGAPPFVLKESTSPT